MDKKIKLFISHKATDAEIADALREYLLAVLEIDLAEIRVTSLIGGGVPAGEPIHEVLRKDLRHKIGLIALLTNDSLESTWVKFELGAAWVRKIPILPILGPGLLHGDTRLGPLSTSLTISISSDEIRSKLLDEVARLAQKLEINVRSGGYPNKKLDTFINIFNLYGDIGAALYQHRCRITNPLKGSTISREVAVSIYVENIPTSAYLWIAVKDKNASLMWPKQPLTKDGQISFRDDNFIRDDGNYVMHFQEGGTTKPGQYAIILLGMGRAGNDFIKDWFSKGQSSGSFPGLGINSIPTAHELDSQEGLTLE